MSCSSEIKDTATQNSRTRRSVAKEQVLQTWQQRRLKAEATKDESQPPVTITKSDGTDSERYSPDGTALSAILEPTRASQSQPQQLPSVCYAVAMAWESIWRELGLHNRRKQQTKEQSGSSDEVPKLKEERANLGNKAHFPSVLSILQRNALVRQVQSLQDISVESQVLSVLPSGYDYDKAVKQAAVKRSRAFWLLDLTTIVRTTFDWKQRYCPNTTSNGIQSSTGSLDFVYDIYKSPNADRVLLQVLLRSGIVSLATSTKWDLARALEAVEAAGALRSLVCDSTTAGSKPDGYLREWLVSHVQNDPNRDAGNIPPAQRPLTVHGPEDVVRICASLKRIHDRRLRQHRNQEKSDHEWEGAAQRRNVLQPVATFVLRMDCSLTEWVSVLDATVNSIDACAAQLVGLSFDMSDSDVEQRDAIDQLLGSQLLSAQNTDNKAIRPGLRIDLTGVPGSVKLSQPSLNNSEFPEQVVLWWEDLLKRDNVHKVTIDATRLLVASAGALCTRIIGVREQEDKLNEKEQDCDHEVKLRRHYYIDDGCYGSLYQTDPKNCSPLCPLPLFSHARPDTNEVQSDDSHVSTTVYPTTIWGPTCDGLDQVCKDIPLPFLQRDDWLVFPNVGASNSEGLGTAFNGFDPPDTAYCVLEYFGS